MAGRSPLAPSSFPDCPAVAGVRSATAQAGGAYGERDDLLFVRFDAPAVVAGVFTRSKCASAPVDWCRQHIKSRSARGLVVNAGNANAFTGQRGAEAAAKTATLAAAVVGCSPQDILLASTGVIGEPLRVDQYEAILQRIGPAAGAADWSNAAGAIMTTDTFAKAAGQTMEIDGRQFALTGIAKGSGMIEPDMATMLGFIFTDLPVDGVYLQNVLEQVTQISFNAITVDSDTSTSDTVLAFSTGGAVHPEVPVLASADDPRAGIFNAAMVALCQDLAQQIVRDGEGASKFVTVKVQGAESDASAKIIAKSIANSPLVKTAIAGEDANWGRVVMAVGKAGEPADRDRLSIWFNGIQVANQGARDLGYDEAEVSQVMKAQEIEIRVEMGLDNGTAEVWTCDFTHDYIAINADYRS